MQCPGGRSSLGARFRYVPFADRSAPPRPRAEKSYAAPYCQYGTVKPDAHDQWGFNLYDNYVIQPDLTNEHFLRVYM